MNIKIFLKGIPKLPLSALIFFIVVFILWNFEIIPPPARVVEFLEMLMVDEENLGKQIARKHLSIYNPHIFYSLLKKGIKNGFRY